MPENEPIQESANKDTGSTSAPTPCSAAMFVWLEVTLYYRDKQLCRSICKRVPAPAVPVAGMIVFLCDDEDYCIDAMIVKEVTFWEHGGGTYVVKLEDPDQRYFVDELEHWVRLGWNPEPATECF